MSQHIQKYDQKTFASISLATGEYAKSLQRVRGGPIRIRHDN